MRTVHMRIGKTRNRFLTEALAAILLIAGLVVLAGCASPAPPPIPSPTTTPTPKPAPPTTTPATTPTPPPPASTPAPPPPPTRFVLNVSVNPPDSGTVSPSSGAYDRGSQLTLKATPSGACWTFDYWSGDLGGRAASIAVTVDTDKNITANFVKVKYALSVNVTPPGGGSVGPASGTYDCGQSVTLVATPTAGYQFDSWAGDASGNSANTSLVMQSNKNVTAYFKSLYQTIKSQMPAGSAALNTISFNNQMKAGQKIQGFVELTGERHPEDASFSWHFSIIGPQGVILENWDGNVLSSLHHDFDKTVRFDGTYIMSVRHNSRWPKSLAIQISPGGWQ